jgi:hypothetical protein
MDETTEGLRLEHSFCMVLKIVSPKLRKVNQK